VFLIQEFSVTPDNCRLLSFCARAAHQSAISTWCHVPRHSPPGRHSAASPHLKGRPDSAGLKPTAPSPRCPSVPRCLIARLCSVPPPVRFSCRTLPHYAGRHLTPSVSSRRSSPSAAYLRREASRSKLSEVLGAQSRPSLLTMESSSPLLQHTLGEASLSPRCSRRRARRCAATPERRLGRRSCWSTVVPRCHAAGTAMPPRELSGWARSCRWAAMPQGRGPLRVASLARPWATRTLCKVVTPVLCHWAVSGFGPLDFELFFYFLNGFKTLQS
jgi:hypothetical protein